MAHDRQRFDQWWGVFLSPQPEPDTDWHIVGTGDADRDGKTDLFWHHRTLGNVRVWLMNGVNWIGNSHEIALIDPNWQINGVGDADGDGRPDLLWHNQATGELKVYLMDGLAVRAGLLMNPSHVVTDWQIVAPR